MRNQKNLKEN